MQMERNIMDAQRLIKWAIAALAAAALAAAPIFAGQVPNPVNAPASIGAGNILRASGTNPQQAADSGISGTATAANKVVAGPTSGGAGALTARSLVSADMPASGAGAGSVTSADVSGGTTGLTTSGGPITGSGTITLAGTLAIANGGTGSGTASGARTNLGITATGADTAYAFRANNLSDLVSSSTARTNLGLGIGTNVQAYSADLGTIAGLSPSNDDVLQRKSGAWTNRTLAQLRADMGTSYIVGQSAVASAITGTTTETVLATVTIPASAIGPNGSVEVLTMWTYTNSANNKVLRIKFGTLSLLALTVTTTATARFSASVANRGATNSQIASFSSSGGGFGATTNALTSGAIDTTAAVSLTFTGTLANSGETITLENYIVRINYGA